MHRYHAWVISIDGTLAVDTMVTFRGIAGMGLTLMMNLRLK
ncbi:MAG: hypothetical protein V3W33_04425 [Gammaproteobacteria bacterium]|jgi:hypothetical protein